jgi:hypothetical protein
MKQDIKSQGSDALSYSAF